MTTDHTPDNLQAMGDGLLAKANATHDEALRLLREARKLEHEAFAYYARAEARRIADKLAQDIEGEGQ